MRDSQEVYVSHTAPTTRIMWRIHEVELKSEPGETLAVVLHHQGRTHTQGRFSGKQNLGAPLGHLLPPPPRPRCDSPKPPLLLNPGQGLNSLTCLDSENDPAEQRLGFAQRHPQSERLGAGTQHPEPGPARAPCPSASAHHFFQYSPKCFFAVHRGQSALGFFFCSV